MKKFRRILKKSLVLFLKKVKPIHYLTFVIIIGLGIFNAITGVMPLINQYRYESGIEESFNQWWEETGAEQFRSVGLEPTEKIRNEEFDQFRERALAQKPSYKVEDRIEIMKKDFREWWETKGGKEAFIEKHNRYPGEADFKHELDQWIDNYTDKFTRYHMAFIPKKGDPPDEIVSYIHA